MSEQKIKLEDRKKFLEEHRWDFEELKCIESYAKDLKMLWYKIFSKPDYIKSLKAINPARAKTHGWQIKELNDIERRIEKIKKKYGVKSIDELLIYNSPRKRD